MLFRQGDTIDYLYVVVKGEFILYGYFNYEVPYSKQSTIKIKERCDLRHDDRSHGQMKLFRRMSRIVDGRMETQLDRSQKKVIKNVGQHEVFGEVGIAKNQSISVRNC